MLLRHLMVVIQNWDDSQFQFIISTIFFSQFWFVLTQMNPK